jgi:outer membrane lipoprotein LolB
MTSRAYTARRRGLLAAASCSALLLVGCATVAPQSPAPVSWEQRLPALQAITRFDLEGRLAASNGKDGFSAGLRWQQNNDTAKLDLSAPLGFGAAHIEQSPEGLRITSSQGVTLENAAASQELAATLGFEPPLPSLRYWVLGASDPNFASQESIDPQQRLSHLEQDGWQVEYTEYTQVGRQWLPRRLTVTRQSLRLKLVIDTWRL